MNAGRRNSARPALSGPERAREILRERARALAKRIEPVDVRRKEREVATFSTRAERFAVETRFVQEIVRYVKPAWVPGLPAHFLGVVAFRGEVLPLVELGTLLGTAPESFTEWTRIVVLGRDDAELGLLSTAVHDVTFVPEESLRGIESATPDLVTGFWADGTAFVDGDRLLADPRLFVDQTD